MVFLVAALWSLLVLSVVLTPIGIGRRSWLMLLVAAWLSTGFSVAAGFSVGPLTFLLTCWQLGLALLLRWSQPVDGHPVVRYVVVPVVAGTLIWALVVPVQLAGARWLAWLIAFPLVTLIATLGVLIGPRFPVLTAPPGDA